MAASGQPVHERGAVGECGGDWHSRSAERCGYRAVGKTKRSSYLVSTEDKMIPPDAQRARSKRAGSTVVEVKGSHAVYVSQPRAVADLIAKAANGVALATR